MATLRITNLPKNLLSRALPVRDKTTAILMAARCDVTKMSEAEKIKQYRDLKNKAKQDGAKTFAEFAEIQNANTLVTKIKTHLKENNITDSEENINIVCLMIAVNKYEESYKSREGSGTALGLLAATTALVGFSALGAASISTLFPNLIPSAGPLVAYVGGEAVAGVCGLAAVIWGLTTRNLMVNKTNQKRVEALYKRIADFESAKGVYPLDIMVFNCELSELSTRAINAEDMLDLIENKSMSANDVIMILNHFYSDDHLHPELQARIGSDYIKIKDCIISEKSAEEAYIAGRGEDIRLLGQEVPKLPVDPVIAQALFCAHLIRLLSNKKAEGKFPEINLAELTKAYSEFHGNCIAEVTRDDIAIADSSKEKVVSQLNKIKYDLIPRETTTSRAASIPLTPSTAPTFSGHDTIEAGGADRLKQTKSEAERT